MFANIGEFFVSSSLLESLAVDELPPAKWTDGLTVELLVAKLPVECFGDEKPPAKWNAGWTAELLATELPGERVVAEARAIEAEYAEGREIGRLQEKQSIVRKLKAMGVDPELISQASGMSLEEIDQL